MMVFTLNAGIQKKSKCRITSGTAFAVVANLTIAMD